MKYSKLRQFLLKKSDDLGYKRWNLHFKSLFSWYLYEKDIEEIINMVPQNTLMLDAGCSFGQITEMLNLERMKVVGLDVNEKKTWRYLHAPFIVGDGCSLPFKDRTFGAILVYALLEHIGREKEFTFLGEVHRCLKSKGLAFFYELPRVFSREYILCKLGFGHAPRRIRVGHNRYYIQTEVEKLLRTTGFDVLTVKPYCFVPRLIPQLNPLYKILISLDRGSFNKSLMNMVMKPLSSFYRIIAKKA